MLARTWAKPGQRTFPPWENAPPRNQSPRPSATIALAAPPLSRGKGCGRPVLADSGSAVPVLGPTRLKAGAQEDSAAGDSDRRHVGVRRVDRRRHLADTGPRD
jgi:hypothetical protein